MSLPSSDSRKTKGRISCQVVWGKFTLSAQLMLASKPRKHTHIKILSTHNNTDSVPKTLNVFKLVGFLSIIAINECVPHPLPLWPLHVITQGSLTAPSPSTLLSETPDSLIVRNHEENSRTKPFWDSSSTHQICPRHEKTKQSEYFDLLRTSLTRWRKLLEILFPPLS